MGKLKICCAFAVFGLLTGCTSDSGDIRMNSINGSWDKKQIQNFDLSITDSQNPKNIIFVVRNNSEYPYSNIRFIVSLTDLKSRKSAVDTLNYILAKPNGEWIGTGFGDTKEILFQYKLNHKFPANGKYRIGIIQAMRKDKLPGIEDIGVKLENIKP